MRSRGRTPPAHDDTEPSEQRVFAAGLLPYPAETAQRIPAACSGRQAQASNKGLHRLLPSYWRMGSWRVRTRARAWGESVLEPRIEPVVGNATNARSPKEMKKKVSFCHAKMALPFFSPFCRKRALAHIGGRSCCGRVSVGRGTDY